MTEETEAVPDAEDCDLRPERELSDGACPCTIYGKDCKEPYYVNKNAKKDSP